MPERNPAAFAGVGSGPIRVLACVSERVEIRIASAFFSGEPPDIGFGIAGKPIVRLNRYACRDP
jgi:hypothetical protein